MTSWPVERLGALCDIKIGKTPSRARPDFWGPGFPWLSIADMNQGRELVSTRESITERAVSETNHHQVVPGTVLMSFKLSIGKIGVARVPMYTNEAIAHLPVKNKGRLLPEYLCWALSAADLGQGADRAAMGSTLNSAKLRDITIPVPPIEEQRRIAEVLDSAEALRAKRREAIAKLDALTQAIFRDMFGDASKNSKQWPQVTLSDVIRGRPDTGIFRKNPEYAEDGRGLPVIWVEELFRGAWIDASASRRVVPTESEISKYGLQNGDILFCRSSLKLDGIAFNNVYLGPDDGALFECHVIRVQPDAEVVSSLYLNALLRSPEMRAIAKAKSNTATMTTIDQDAVCSLPVMLPPRQAQEQYALRLVELERLRTTYSASLTYLNALFSSLQHRAFRGEL